MGAFNEAEVCELVGSFLLHKLSEKHETRTRTSLSTVMMD